MSTHEENLAKAAAANPPAGYDPDLAWPTQYGVLQKGRGGCDAIRLPDVFGRPVRTEIEALAEIAAKVQEGYLLDPIASQAAHEERRRADRQYHRNEAAARQLLDDTVAPFRFALVKAESDFEKSHGGPRRDLQRSLDSIEPEKRTYKRHVESQYVDLRDKTETHADRDIVRRNAIRLLDDADSYYRALWQERREKLRKAESDYLTAWQAESTPLREALNKAAQDARDVFDATLGKAQAARDARIEAANEKARADSLSFFVPVPLTWREVQARHVRIESDADRSRRLVWERQRFWWNNESIFRDHYPLRSEKDHTLINYIADARKGQRGIRTPIKPGKYLAMFFGHILTPKEIAYYAAWQITGSKPSPYTDDSQFVLLFANTRETIREVYSRGPASCMSHGVDDYQTKGVHPVEAYAAGDLAIAYLAPAKESDRKGQYIPARALVWPEKKVVGRIYPGGDTPTTEASEGLKARLMASGYKSQYTDHSLMNGARMLAIPRPGGYVTPRTGGAGGYVMPYLDITRSFSWDKEGKGFVIDTGGPYTAGETNGVVYVESPDDAGVCGDWECHSCSDELNADDGDTPVMVFTRLLTNGTPTGRQPYCESCADSHAYMCSGHNALMADSIDHVQVGCETYTRLWLNRNAVHSDRSGWHINRPGGTTYRLQLLITDARRMTVHYWVQSEFREHGFICPVSGESWARDQGFVCAITGRLASPSGRRGGEPRIARDCTRSQIDSWIAAGRPDYTGPAMPINSEC